MDYTPRLRLPELTVGQAGKEVTVNESHRILDALVQSVVIDKDLADAPADPADGDMYIVAAGSSSGDEWAGHEDDVAYFESSAWVYHTPEAGWRVYVDDEATSYVYDGGAWNAVESMVGVNSYDISISKAGKPDAGEMLARIVFVRSVSFEDDFSGSQGSSGVAADATAIVSIKKNGAEVGTATWSAAGSTAAFATGGGGVSFVAGDVLTFIAPASQDATLEDIGITLKGTKA